jgi:hypothetical protein
MADTTRIVLSYEAKDGEDEEKVLEVAEKLNELFDAYPHLKAEVTIEASAQVLLDRARST